MLKTFFINTATQQTSIALFEEDKMIAEQCWSAHFDEAQRLQPAVEEILSKQELTPDDIDRLVCCIGPGGFTSVRVGVSAVNAWSFAKQIPSASISVFDLYQGFDGLLFITTNQNEAWLQAPGKSPLFIQKSEIVLPKVFSFGGMPDEDWKIWLSEQGGTFVPLKEKFPPPGQLHFEHAILKPWYYKDPHITWSKILKSQIPEPRSQKQ